MAKSEYTLPSILDALAAMEVFRGSAQGRGREDDRAALTMARNVLLRCRAVLKAWVGDVESGGGLSAEESRTLDAVRELIGFGETPA